VELQRRLDDFIAAGVRVFAVTPEPVEKIAAFTDEYGIKFPVLADADSTVIRQYGILNTLIEPDEQLYGLPFPGSYLTDHDGRITAKFFNRRYQEREAPEIVFHDGLALPVDISGHPDATDGSVVTAVLATPALTFQQHTALLVRLNLKPGLHVYGQPVPEGYIATTVTVKAPDSVIVGDPVYPATRPFQVQGLDERFHVFDGDVEIEVPLLSAERKEETVSFEIEVSYQACDDRTCYLPQTAELTIEAPTAMVNSPQRRG